LQARTDAGEGPGGDYFSSGGRNGTAGVGAKYLGQGKYAESDEEDSLDEDDRSYSGHEGDLSQESFVPPKKQKWKIWK
jgi:hypothetical protein